MNASASERLSRPSTPKPRVSATSTYMYAITAMLAAMTTSESTKSTINPSDIVNRLYHESADDHVNRKNEYSSYMPLMSTYPATASITAPATMNTIHESTTYCSTTCEST